MFVHGSVKAPGSRSLLSCSLAISRPQHQRGQSHAARLVFQQQQHLPRKVWLTRHQRTVPGAVYSIIYQVMFTIKRCGIQYLPHPSAGVAARQRPFGEEDLCQTRFSARYAYMQTSAHVRVGALPPVGLCIKSYIEAWRMVCSMRGCCASRHAPW